MKIFVLLFLLKPFSAILYPESCSEHVNMRPSSENEVEFMVKLETNFERRIWAADLHFDKSIQDIKVIYPRTATINSQRVNETMWRIVDAGPEHYEDRIIEFVFHVLYFTNSTTQPQILIGVNAETACSDLHYDKHSGSYNRIKRSSSVDRYRDRIGGYGFTETYSNVAADCGKQHIKGRVVRGERTYPGEFPWTVGIHIQKQGFFCGGALVTSYYTVTAGHCVSDHRGNLKPMNTFTLYFGIYDLESPNDQHVVQKRVSQTVRHHLYKHIQLAHDVALIKTAEPVTFTQYISPACMGYVAKTFGKHGIVAGWGVTELHKSSRYLLKATLLKSLPRVCRDTHEQLRKTTQFAYCAGYNNGTNVCFGDSGSGMVFLHNSKFYVGGVVSFGVGSPDHRCYGGYQDIFTNLDSYWKWIYWVMERY